MTSSAAQPSIDGTRLPAQRYLEALDSDLDWEAPLAFTTRTYGAAKASLKTIFFHSIFHGIRHYAQLSTLARQNGYQIDWPGDYLFMGATRG